MKAILTTLTFLLIRLVSFGQFAVISDSDGFVNLRKSPELINNIISKIPNGQIVFCLESDNPKWRTVDYIKEKSTISGFVYSSRLNYIDNYKTIKPILENRDQLEFKVAETTITLSIKTFNAGKNKLSFSKSMPNFLEKINGKKIWGTDGNIPKYEYKEIVLNKGNSIIKLQRDNLYEPNLKSTKVNYDEKSNIIYLTASNSDGAGGYVVLWVIKDGKLLNQIITTPF
jgi:hypothetical protein